MKKGSGKRPKKQNPLRKKSPQGKRTKSSKPAERVDISLEELKAILEKTKTGPLSDDEFQKLGGAVDTLAVLTSELEAKGASVRRLRRLIFGPSTEKTRDILGDLSSDETPDATGAVDGTDAETASAGVEDLSTDGNSGKDNQPSGEKKKRKGHGRKGSKDYTGAERIKVPHENLKHKDDCPECLRGKLYIQKEPATIVRVTGMAPLQAVVYERERLRCNLCGEVFTAAAPEGVGEEKYDATAAAMIALLKYGCGMPFNRLERLEADLGIPLPASTQWEVVEPAAKSLAPVFTELIRQAAQGEVLHNDDTTAKILALMGERGVKERKSDDEMDPDRTGLFTSGIVSVEGARQIALFFTGRKHAGENLADVLKYRAEELAPPIQMSDGLSANTAGDMETFPAGCNAHARRRYIDVAENFPKEVRFVLEKLKEVYAYDDHCKQQEMSAAERLAYHQQHSGPIMKELEEWLKDQIEGHKVEPNSSLGEAITYMRKHWSKLTLFLHREAAPLDNNLCERILKKAILHRKNAMFFKTKNGAWVGDLFMTLIHTSELAKINVYDYLVALLKNEREIAKAPELWMPWNYRDALEQLDKSNEVAASVID